MLKPQPTLMGSLALILLLSALVLGQGADGLDNKVERKLSVAAAQHELIQMLLDQGRYEEAINELNEIYALGLPVEFEEAVTTEIIIVAHKLFKKKQTELAHRVLDDGLEQVEKDENKVKLLKLKAKIYRDSGDNSRAIETYRRALEIEKRQLSK